MRAAIPVRLLVASAVVLSLAACGSEEPSSTSPTTSGESPTVSGAFGDAPEIELPSGAYDGSDAADVVAEGDGEPVADGDVVVADYQALVWSSGSGDEDDTATPGADGEPIFDTFESGQPEAFTMTEGRILDGMRDGLVGVPVGSRVLLVISPEDGFGDQGRADIGLGPEDGLVFVFDVLDSFAADAAASGTPAEVDPALPQVAEGDAGPTVTVPGTTPPTELVSQVLITGDGAVVETGQLIVVQYRGVLWKDGSEFDASWTGGAPASFPIGVQSVISGWDKGLVGQTIGSRVLLVVPPAEGYGAAGSPPKIAGDDTLVFVVDILGAYGGGSDAG